MKHLRSSVPMTAWNVNTDKLLYIVGEYHNVCLTQIKKCVQDDKSVDKHYMHFAKSSAASELQQAFLCYLDLKKKSRCSDLFVC